MGFFQKLFDTSDFVPRWSCGAWSDRLAWTHMISDFVIFLSYAAIPAALAVIVLRRRDLPHARIWMLFVAFILSCGLTHLVESLMFYHPLYRLSGLMKVVTAAVSMVTAVALAGVLPGIIALPRLRLANAELTNELDRERQLARDLTEAREELEERSAHVTARFRRFGAALAASGAVACRWEAESGAIDWQMGLADALRSLGLPSGNLPRNFTDLIGPDAASQLREAARRVMTTGEPLDFSASMTGLPQRHFRISAQPEPEVAGQARYLIGMFRFTLQP